MTFHLVHTPISRDTLESFNTLAHGAAQGLFIGGAFIVLMPRKRYIVDTCGQLAKEPELARGLLRSLDDELREMVRAGVAPPTMK